MKIVIATNCILACRLLGFHEQLSPVAEVSTQHLAFMCRLILEGRLTLIGLAAGIFRPFLNGFASLSLDQGIMLEARLLD